ncbi:15621_t:CDS:10 [Entrophospora sp. SA101]|nr:15621_t:CDS:10 [Entrophospora sp. SA101]
MSETSSVSLEKIYKAYEDIDAAGNDEESLAKVKGSYEALIAAAHAESNCKRLAAQFIPRFFGKFPDFHETAIDALFDLCEDQDLNVRLTVIKHLPNVVKESKKYSLRITDALVQLLQNGSSQELLVVKKAIEQVIRIDPQASLRFIIQQAIVGSTEVKKHTINFLSVDLNKFKNELFDQHKDLEQFFADEIQKVLHEAEFFELEIFISMLSSLKVYENNKSKLQDLSKSLINAIVTEKETFDPNDENFFQKFVLCGKTILKLFENGVSGTEFLSLLIKILPYQTYSKLNEKQQITVLHYLAECASTSLDDEIMKAAAPLIKDLFINEIPAPPKEAMAEDPKLNLSKAESIVYSLYVFASKIPDVAEGEQINSRSIESDVTTLPTRNKIQKTSRDKPNIQPQNSKTSHIIRQPNKMSPKHGGSSGNMRNSGGSGSARPLKIDRNSNKERHIYVPPPRRGT